MIAPRLTSVMHPSTRLCLWLVLMVIAQFLTGHWLLLALCLVMLLMRREVLKRGFKLAWRARWLLASLFCVFAWGTAGEPLWEGLASPTWEGLHDATTHGGRLLLMFALVAAFLDAMPVSELLTALFPLCATLRHMGFKPERGIVRLMLVLRYVETLPRPRDWRALLDVPPQETCEAILVDDAPLSWLDIGVLTAVVLAVIVIVQRGLAT